jgi:hypothetical protein
LGHNREMDLLGGILEIVEEERKNKKNSRQVGHIE